MKHKFLFLLGGILFTMWFTSCETTEIPQKSTKGIELKNGLLVFADEQIFEQTRATFESSDHKPGEFLNDVYPEFVSTEKAYEALVDIDFEPIVAQRSLDGFQQLVHITEVNGEKEAICQISDPFLMAIANAYGMYQIGSTVHKLFYDYELQATNVAVQQLDELAYLEEGEVPVYCTKFDFNREKQLTSSAPTRSYCPQYYNSISEYNQNPDLRIRSELRRICNNTPGLVTTTFRLEVRHQRKRTGIWFQRRANEISVTLTANSRSNKEAPGDWFGDVPWENASGTFVRTVQNQRDLFYNVLETAPTNVCIPAQTGGDFYLVDLDFIIEVEDKNGDTGQDSFFIDCF